MPESVGRVPSGQTRCTRWMAGFLLLGMAWLLGAPAAADPGRGEVRSILRDAERIYGAVAGEADASSTVQNPGNLSYLQGLNAVLDASYSRQQSRTRGSGAGLFLGGPLWRDLVGAGIGYQLLLPLQPDISDGSAGGEGDVDLDAADRPYSKLTAGASLGLTRWARGLSLGVSYSRLFSRNNYYAYQVDQFDAGLSWRASRFLALGVVGRGLNQPRVGPGVVGVPASVGSTRQMPLAIDPELAFRPLGDARLEVGVGARIEPYRTPDRRFATDRWLYPRGRVLAGTNGVHLFATIEGFSYNDPQYIDRSATGLRASAGLMLQFDHIGLGGGPTVLSGQTARVEGGAGRIRLSREQYTQTFRQSPRIVTRFPLAAYHGDRGVAQLVKRIDQLARRGARYILLETRGLTFSYAQLEEVREAVLRFRWDGGKVAAYLEGGDLKAYFVASAADRILAHPIRQLNMVGMSTQTVYFGELLDELGVEAELIRVAEYKATPERWAHTTASEPVARQRRLLLGDAWNHVLRLIERERGRDMATIGTWIDGAPHRPRQAQDLGIVDDLCYPDELDENLEAWLDRRVRIELPPERPTRDNEFGPHPRVAVLYVDGAISGGESRRFPLVGVSVVGATSMARQIRELRQDRTVRAIVVRLDTPGGYVSAAETIARELELTAREKPVVVSIGTRATSAGYLIASAGDYIVADATSQTGSIGVYWLALDLTGLMARIGVSVDTQSIGEHATWASRWGAMSEENKKVARETIQDEYDRFVVRVGRARSISPERLDKLARGRVWSGIRATENGLVDAYGGLREAVIRARKMAGLPLGVGEVVDYPAMPSLVEQVRSLFGLRLAAPEGEVPGVEADAVLPLLRTLRRLPAPFWLMGEPQALGVSAYRFEIE